MTEDGSINKSYIVCESENGILFVDQHAGAERVLYEKLKRNLEQGKNKFQTLLIPNEIKLSYSEKLILESNLNHFLQVGFVLEKKSEFIYLVKAVPVGLQNFDTKKIVLEIIDDLSEEEKTSLEEKTEKIIKYAACRGSVKFNHVLIIEEMKSLLKDIFDLGLYSCPHGRPIVLEITLEKLAMLFKRG